MGTEEEKFKMYKIIELFKMSENIIPILTSNNWLDGSPNLLLIIKESGYQEFHTSSLRILRGSGKDP